MCRFAWFFCHLISRSHFRKNLMFCKLNDHIFLVFRAVKISWRGSRKFEPIRLQCQWPKSVTWWHVPFCCFRASPPSWNSFFIQVYFPSHTCTFLLVGLFTHLMQTKWKSYIKRLTFGEDQYCESGGISAVLCGDISALRHLDGIKQDECINLQMVNLVVLKASECYLQPALSGCLQSKRRI